MRGRCNCHCHIHCFVLDHWVNNLCIYNPATVKSNAHINYQINFFLLPLANKQLIKVYNFPFHPCSRKLEFLFVFLLVTPSFFYLTVFGFQRHQVYFHNQIYPNQMKCITFCTTSPNWCVGSRRQQITAIQTTSAREHRLQLSRSVGKMKGGGKLWIFFFFSF